MTRRLNYNTQIVLEVCRDLFVSGNHDPTKAEIIKTMFGSLTPYSEKVVGHALKILPDWFREEGDERVVPVGRYYYDDEDIGGLGRKAPKSVQEARSGLAVFGRPIYGLIHVTGNGNKGYQLFFLAYEAFWRRHLMVAEENNKAKIERFETKGWLKPGEVSKLAIADIDRLFLQ